jgi:hypothetical protein
MAAVRHLLAALACILPLQAAADPFAIQLGDARVALDAPPGFADTGFTGSPRLQEHAESLTSASNRVLLFAISDADLRRFMGGDQMELKRYMVIATPKNAERDSLGTGGFARLTDNSLRALGAAPPAGTDYPRHLDSQPAGRASLLAELTKTSTVVSVLQGTRLPPAKRNEPPTYVLSTNTLLLVRGKALSLAVFSGYETDQDVDWIRDVTVRWVDDLKRLNR